MNEIMVKTYELIDEIDKSDAVKNIGIYKKKVLEDKELCELISMGNSSDDKYLVMDIKRELYKNSNYKGYMDCYNELFYIVMRINKMFDKFINRRCYK